MTFYHTLTSQRLLPQLDMRDDKLLIDPTYDRELSSDYQSYIPMHALSSFCGVQIFERLKSSTNMSTMYNNRVR